MEHFSAIQSLCRVGLEQGDARFRRQVERLRDRLKKAGDERDADVLGGLLNSVSGEASLAPSIVEVSRSLVSGDELTANVQAPVDRETSVPLAEIVLEPGLGKPEPIYNETLHLALAGLISEWERTSALQAMGVEPDRKSVV